MTTIPGAAAAAVEASGPRVRAEGITKRYGDGSAAVTALDDVSVSLNPGEMVVLLGPSGCGKTTLLRSIAGLEQPQGGRIWIEGRKVYDAAAGLWVPPERRHVGMVFQSYALWPHMTVMENIAYPLRNRGDDARRVTARVGELLDAVGLTGKAARRPAELSGGQQQRVALARAIAAGNNVVLFDEPLSNVDAKVRGEIRREIVSLQQRIGFAGLYVTHDQVEAGAIASTLVIMDHGHVVQSGRPADVYDRPATRYVANFMGPSNESGGRPLGAGPEGSVLVETEWGPVAGTVCGAGMIGTDAVDVLFRPENCQLSVARPEGANVFCGQVLREVFMGAFVEICLQIEVGGRPVEIFATAPKAVFTGALSLYAQVPPASMWIFAR